MRHRRLSTQGGRGSWRHHNAILDHSSSCQSCSRVGTHNSGIRLHPVDVLGRWDTRSRAAWDIPVGHKHHRCRSCLRRMACRRSTQPSHIRRRCSVAHRSRHQLYSPAQSCSGQRRTLARCCNPFLCGIRTAPRRIGTRNSKGRALVRRTRVRHRHWRGIHRIQHAERRRPARRPHSCLRRFGHLRHTPPRLAGRKGPPATSSSLPGATEALVPDAALGHLTASMGG